MSKIIKGLKKPHRVPKYTYRKVGSGIESFNQSYLKMRYEILNKHDERVTNLVEKDWDNIIILDACRYDYFKRQNTIDGRLQPVYSPGSESWAFMEYNFQGRSIHDSIYITANPHSVRLDSQTFFKLIQTLDDWDSELEVVHPRTVTEKAVTMHEKHPDKKLIIHFMQPHTPWLGETARRIRENVNVYGNNKNHGFKKLGHEVDDPRDGDMKWFEAVEKGHISHEKMKQAYSETLDIVLEHVEDLLDKLNGKTIITSDHGEMLGERVGLKRYYGHPSDLITTHLRKVPWLEVPFEERRTVSIDEPEKRDALEEDIVQDRLEALGYK